MLNFVNGNCVILNCCWNIKLPLDYNHLIAQFITTITFPEMQKYCYLVDIKQKKNPTQMAKISLLSNSNALLSVLFIHTGISC